MKPAIVMKWPGAVPIFLKCKLCDGKGHTVINPGVRRLVSEDGSIVCSMLTGSIMWCYRCNGWGSTTRYGSRGKSFTPIRPLRKRGIWGRLHNG